MPENSNEALVDGNRLSVTDVIVESYLTHSTSAVVRELERNTIEVARTNIPVLLLGESGTGKEIVAERIHTLSARREERFLKLSCGIGPETLGRQIRANANGRSARLSPVGTVLLDEVGELEPASQSNLLHMILDGEGLSLGPHPVARLISCTRRDLKSEVQAGVFREALYYRINGLQLVLPPLRDRREDIPALVRLFLRAHAAAYQRSIPSLSPQVEMALQEHPWPGNIRQLNNVVRKIVLFSDAQSVIADLNSAFPEGEPSNGSCSLKHVSRAASRNAERDLILKTLTRTRWNRKLAARELQISYKALLYKLKQVGMEESSSYGARGGKQT